MKYVNKCPFCENSRFENNKLVNLTTSDNIDISGIRAPNIMSKAGQRIKYIFVVFSIL